MASGSFVVPEENTNASLHELREEVQGKIRLARTGTPEDDRVLQEFVLAKAERSARPVIEHVANVERARRPSRGWQGEKLVWVVRAEDAARGRAYLSLDQNSKVWWCAREDLLPMRYFFRTDRPEFAEEGFHESVGVRASCWESRVRSSAWSACSRSSTSRS